MEVIHSSPSAKRSAVAQDLNERAETSGDPPKIYPVIFHPEKSWHDVLVGIIVSFFLPFYVVADVKGGFQRSNHSKDIEHARAQTIRQAISAHDAQAAAKYVRSLKQFALIECVLKVPNRPQLLKEWGYIDEKTYSAVEGGDCIEVVMFFPDSLLPEDLQGSDLADLPTTPLGCISCSSFDLDSLPEDVEVIVFLHGGGLTLCAARDAEVVKLYGHLLEEGLKKGKKRAVFLSVEYSLAPEHPFPVAQVEVLAVLAHLMEAHPHRSFHIGGISAGGYLAAVATMELNRRFPGRLSSALLACPMVEPTADSLSYYQNSKSSHICPVYFLRWCWRVYLQLPTENDSITDSKGTDEVPNLSKLDESTSSEASLQPKCDDLLAVGSNRDAWNRSPWKGTQMERLIRPLADIPSNMSTRFMVVTNRADPLKDEGLALVAKLRGMGNQVEHLDFGGSHWLGVSSDPQSYQSLVETWANQVYDNING